MTTRNGNGYSAEVGERAVWMVKEHRGEYASQWETIGSVAAKIGCTGETLRMWVRRAERDTGVRPCPTSAELSRIRELGRENRELRQASGILRKASACFAQAELDRPPETMIAVIDAHREAYGVEPICRVLPIAPSTYHDHTAKRRDPSRLPARRSGMRR